MKYPYPDDTLHDMAELILGGARSGKSALAEARAHAFGTSGASVIVVATAEIRDEEMDKRIRHHRDRRPKEWHCVEEPLHLAQALQEHAAPDRCLLVDCLTLWLSNLLLTDRIAKEVPAFLETLPHLPGHILLVSNEVGTGIVPDNALARQFRDEQGMLNQRVAALCERVTLVVAGLPLELKQTWRARHDSNVRPQPSEGCTLSI